MWEFEIFFFLNRSLLEMTENSYKFPEVTRMEMELLERRGFVAYGIEPMLFINRYIRKFKYWEMMVV